MRGPGKKTLRQRFDEKWTLADSGCKEFKGKPGTHKTMWVAGKGRIGAHWVAWFLETGTWPTDTLLHTCDNPPCVEFAHLRHGSQAENVTDMVLKGRNRNGYDERTHCPQNHEYSETNTYVDPRGWRGCRKCRSASAVKCKRNAITKEPALLADDIRTRYRRKDQQL